MQLARGFARWLALVAVAAVVLIATSVWLLDNPWTAALPALALVAALAPLNALIQHRMQDRIARRLLTREVVEGALRTADDSPLGRAGRWRHGQMHLSPGRIHLVPLTGGVRFIKGTPLDIAVEAVHPTGQTTRMGVSVLGGLSILNARSAIGTIEIAVRPGMEKAVITKLVP